MKPGKTRTCWNALFSSRRRIALALAFVVVHGPHITGQGESTRPAEPENLNVRIIGTACFQGRWSAFIEDMNTRSDSFYSVGDPVYGFKITEIATDGIYLERARRKFFVPIKSVPVQAVVSADSGKTVIANTYLPDTQSPGRVTPNFYVEGSSRPTQWDYYVPPSEPSKSRPAQAELAAPKAPARGGRFAFPLASFKRLSSGFGYRRHPIGGNTKMHNGIDLSAKTGTKIFAGDAGTVTFSGWRGGYGYCVEIDHHNGFKTIYGHCSKLLADVGDNVRRGEYVAQVGSTGASTGPHLHFEVRRGNTPIDPEPFFKGVL